MCPDVTMPVETVLSHSRAFEAVSAFLTVKQNGLISVQ